MDCYLVDKILNFIAISLQLETVANYGFSCGKWIDWENPNNGDIDAKLNWLKVKLYYDKLHHALINI